VVWGDRPARGFFGGVPGFVDEDTFFGSTAARAFLASGFFDAIAFGVGEPAFLGIDLVEEDLACEEPVEALLAGDLAFYFETGGPMGEHDAGRGLVDVLTAVATGADETFVEIIFMDPKHRHAPFEFGYFLWADRKGAHGIIVTDVG
jgi:hypothetical protein